MVYFQKMKFISLIASVTAVLAVIHEAVGHHNPMYKIEDKCGCCPKPCCCHCVTKEVIQPSTSTSTSTTSTPPLKCYDVLDLAWCVDTSQSIADDPDDWIVVRQFIVDILSQLDIGKDLIRVAAVLYGNNASVVFDFNSDYNENRDTLIEGLLKNMVKMGGLTNTPECLELLADIVFPLSGRPYAPKLAVIMTDGEVNFRVHEFDSLAKKLQSVTDLVIAIGLPPIVNETRLEVLATGKGHSNVFYMNDFNAILNKMDDMTGERCEEQPVKRSISTTPPSPQQPAVEECFCCCPPPPAIYHHSHHLADRHGYRHGYGQNHGHYKPCPHC